jgi:hypothetical protein
MFHTKRPTTPNAAVKEFTMTSGTAAYTDGEEFPMDIQRRMDAMATLVNLACAEENKYLMANHSDLLRDILVVGNTDPVAGCREHAATILMNLSYHEPNQQLLGNHDQVLDTLVVLMGDNLAPTRRYASAALFTLACVLSNATVMTSHRGGSILESLRVALLEDMSEEARINAAEALWHFAKNGHAYEQEQQVLQEEKDKVSSTTSPIEHMSNHPGLMVGLSMAVTRDENPEVRNFAARALEWLAGSLHFPAEAHRSLLTALVVSSEWTGASSISQGFLNQASNSQNRLPMVQHPGLLDALANLALLQALELQHVRSPAVAAIEQLSQEKLARSAMKKHEGIMMALTKATFNAEEEEAAGGGGMSEYDEHGQAHQLDGMTTTTQAMRAALKNLTNAIY